MKMLKSVLVRPEDKGKPVDLGWGTSRTGQPYTPGGTNLIIRSTIKGDRYMVEAQTPVHDTTNIEEGLAFDFCNSRQKQIEAGAILIEDLSHCGLTQNESRVLGLLTAGWTINEAAEIMGIHRQTVRFAVRSMQVKIRPLLGPH